MHYYGPPLKFVFESKNEQLKYKFTDLDMVHRLLYEDASTAFKIGQQLRFNCNNIIYVITNISVGKYSAIENIYISISPPFEDDEPDDMITINVSMEPTNLLSKLSNQN